MAPRATFLAALLFLIFRNIAGFKTTFRQHFLTRPVHVAKSGAVFSTVQDAPTDVEEKIIIITPKAMAHISDLKTRQGLGTLRMGVRSGGCSGMSYVMDFIVDGQITEDDHIELYGDVKCVVDPKSLLYLYGLQLDYSDELIGGGFKFSNPNAETSW
jgi:iron-sulfur cluster assembly protein